MFRKILVPTDGSSHSDKAADTAIELARRLDARLLALAVVEPYPFPPISESPYAGGSEAYERRAEEIARDHVNRIVAAAEAAHVPCEGIVIPGLNPHDEINKAVDAHGCDAIVMASHGRKGLDRIFTGSETQRVLAQAHVPVMVIR